MWGFPRRTVRCRRSVSFANTARRSRSICSSRLSPSWARFSLPDFLKSRNLFNVLLQSVALGLVAIGQTFVILGGGIDLSVGATISMVAVYASGLMAGSPALGVAIPVILLVVCMALAVGLTNSLLVNRLRIAPFIATMAVGSIVQGVVLMYTKRPKRPDLAMVELFCKRNNRAGSVCCHFPAHRHSCCSIHLDKDGDRPPRVCYRGERAFGTSIRDSNPQGGPLHLPVLQLHGCPVCYCFSSAAWG